jgi:hypothetical protein
LNERYCNYLDPSIAKKQWTIEEDEKLMESVQKHGTQWRLISKSFEGRNAVNIKNRWYYYLSKRCSMKEINVDTKFLTMKGNFFNQNIPFFDINDQNRSNFAVDKAKNQKAISIHSNEKILFILMKKFLEQFYLKFFLLKKMKILKKVYMK